MKTQQRLCDFCGDSLAVLYCRADSAKLCLSCDREVHSTNQLFTKHTRSLLCDACDSSPASILCSSESSALCQNCDWERHSHSPSSPHDRRPLEGFSGCPSVTDLLALFGLDDVSKKALLGGGDYIFGSGVFGSEGAVDGYSDYLVWDTPPIVTLDDLVSSNSSEHSFQAIGVPPLPKNRKATCGKYKDDILNQLREMAKSEPNFSDGHGDSEPLMQFDSLVPEQDQQPGNMYTGFDRGVELATTVPLYKACAFWCNDNGELANQGLPFKLEESYVEENCLVPDKNSNIGGGSSQVNCGPEGQTEDQVLPETLQVLPKVAARELSSQERDSAISRYKEKRKTRRYDKHIRYESRRIRAENRTRVKGRFAKMEH